MKSLLFFSNPFGYGPTATMMAVLRHFTNLTNVKIYVIARGLCAEILDNNMHSLGQFHYRNPNNPNSLYFWKVVEQIHNKKIYTDFPPSKRSLCHPKEDV